MTKGTSTRRKNRLPGSLYGNFDPGNNDKLMISYSRVPSHDYVMYGACGVLFQGEIHFFGGKAFGDGDLSRQHFVIEIQRSGQTVKLTRKRDPKIGFGNPSCSSFETTSEYFPWFQTSVAIICFDSSRAQSCYLYDDDLDYIGDSDYGHSSGGLTKYKGALLTVGGLPGFTLYPKTEILSQDANETFSWSTVEQDFEFYQIQYMWSSSILGHSLVTIESPGINEEYVLLIGGNNELGKLLKDVFKFDGSWLRFGTLNRGRNSHNSIYWNGAVYVIGGAYDYFQHKTKMEIWNIKDSPDKFKTTENWPELFDWESPHLFIVPDSFFPDH